MSDKKKISVIVLGNEDFLKKALIAIILGKNQPKVIETTVRGAEEYENEICKCTNITDSGNRDIKQLFAPNRYPDMSLLVIEDGFPDDKVLEQIDRLCRTTGRPTEEFRVVLPFGYNQPDSYLFNFYTIEQLFTELRELAKKRGLTSTNSRPAAVQTLPNARPSCTPMEVTVNLVLLGMSGTGKSASGNTILGKNCFISKASSQPVTSEFEVEEILRDGKRVRVIDTPDMFGDRIKPSVKDRHVENFKQFNRPGPCVFVLVMHISRFTESERDILKKMEKAFGKKVKQQTVILFTRGDDLKRTGMSLDNFLSSCQPDLKKVVDKCENRCVVFENRTSDPQQVGELMQKVENVLEKQKVLVTERPQLKKKQKQKKKQSNEYKK